MRTESSSVARTVQFGRGSAGATQATSAAVAIDPAWAAVIGGRPAFWLGPEVNGMPVTDVRDVDGRILVEYGPCMKQPEPSAECVRQLCVTTQTPLVWEGRSRSFWRDPASPESEAEICDRHPSVLGVPAATLLGELTVFTGPSLVGVQYMQLVPDGLISDDDMEGGLPASSARSDTTPRPHCRHRTRTPQPSAIAIASSERTPPRGGRGVCGFRENRDGQ